MKYIEKKSVVPIELATGSIFDTTNIGDKTKNTYSARIIDEMNTYSTEETMVGIWHNNKPLYRKTIIFPNGTGTEEQVSYNLSEYGINNVDEIFIAHPSYYSLPSADGFITTFPLNFYDGKTYMAQVAPQYLGLQLQYGDIANSKCVITLEYTKTTD